MNQTTTPTDSTPEAIAAEWMNGNFDKGATVTITTHHISIKITPKIRDSFRAAGMEIIYVDKSGNLRVRRSAKRNEIILLGSVKIEAWA